MSFLSIDDDEVVLCVTPVVLEEAPDFTVPLGFEKADPTDWFDYLSDTRLYVLSGVNIGCNLSDGYCDYCGFEIGGDTQYYCQECKTSMCEKCFPEKTEEIAISLGANNYSKRKDALEKCFAHSDSLVARDTLKKCGVCNVTSFVKDGEWVTIEGSPVAVCSDCFKNGTSNTNPAWETSSDYCGMCGCLAKNSVVWENGFRICRGSGESGGAGGCAEKVTQVVYTPSSNAYGSMLEWVPILQDSERNIVFLNLAKGPRYLQVSLGTFDNHSRMGIYAVSANLTDVLSELEKLQLRYTQKFPATERSWKKHYSSPVSKYLRNIGCQVYFG